MEEEVTPAETTAAPASTGAAPSAGAAGNGSAGAASPTSSTTSLSADQILGIEESSADQPAQPDAATPAADAGAQPGAAEEQQAQQDVQDQPEEQAQPDASDTSAFSVEASTKANPNLKEWMKQDPNVRRAMYGFETAVKKYGTFKDLVEIGDKVSELGGREALDQIVEGDAELFSALESEDIGDHQRLISTLREQKPEAVGRFMANMPQIYRQMDPAGFQANIHNPVIAATLTWHRNQVLAARAQAEAAGNTERVEDMDMLLGFLDQQAQTSTGSVPWEQQAAPDKAVTEARNALKSEQEKFYGEQFQASRDFITSEVRTAIGAEIEKQLEAKIPAAANATAQQAEARKKMLASLAKQVGRELDDLIANDAAIQQATQGLRESIRGKTFDRARNLKVAEKQVANFSKHIPAAIKATLEERALSTPAVNTARTRQRTAASRVDITGGAAPTVRPIAGVSVKDVKSGGRLSKLSDEEILNLP